MGAKIKGAWALLVYMKFYHWLPHILQCCYSHWQNLVFAVYPNGLAVIRHQFVRISAFGLLLGCTKDIDKSRYSWIFWTLLDWNRLFWRRIWRHGKPKPRWCKERNVIKDGILSGCTPESIQIGFAWTTKTHGTPFLFDLLTLVSSYCRSSL